MYIVAESRLSAIPGAVPKTKKAAAAGAGGGGKNSKNSAADGKTADGKAADGKAADGKAADGKAANKAEGGFEVLAKLTGKDLVSDWCSDDPQYSTPFPCHPAQSSCACQQISALTPTFL